MNTGVDDTGRVSNAWSKWKSRFNDYTFETTPVCLVHLVCLMQRDKPGESNRSDAQDWLVDCFSILSANWTDLMGW
jgi:hypothetical protein